MPFLYREPLNEIFLDLLEDRVLRECAGYQIYSRGAAYYRAGRVEVDTCTDQDSRCRVRGTRYYYVALWNYHGELGSSCTCPYADQGWFCKHMVTAALATRDYMKRYGHDSWRQVLSATLEAATKPTKTKQTKPYWFFFSFQSADQGWELSPHRLWVDRVPPGVLPSEVDEIGENLPDLVAHNQWILSHIKDIRADIAPKDCLNANAEVISFAKLMLSQKKQQETNFNYYYRYTYPLAEYLSILTQLDVPVFLGSNTNPIRKKINFSSAVGEAVLNVEPDEAGIRLAMNLIAGGQTIDLATNSAQILTQMEPYWVLAGNQVFELQNSFSPDRLAAWLRTPEISIPPENENEFLENYFPQLAQQFPITGEQVNWEEVEAEPTPRLYLTDDEGEFQSHLRFGYGDFEVVYDPKSTPTGVRRKADSWTLVRIHRELGTEEAAYGNVSSAHHGLKRAGSQHPPDVFLLRAKVDPIDFLMRHVPRLTTSGFEIYGEEKLKSTRVNRNNPTLSLNVSSGIDWFDLQASVKFGDVEATLNEVRRALKRKEKYVKLADGTIGEIPETWIQRYRHLFGLGEQTDDGVRLSNHHLTLIDQLLSDADRAQTDPEFNRRKQRLLDFEGIQARALPAGFTGELRPYQKAGYDWLHFLHEYEFGGCLADDMGLGKTVETLVFLQSLREEDHPKAANLLVLPRSLLVNWEREATKFTPEMKIHQHFGTTRNQDFSEFSKFDLILTTYGTMLRDIEKLREYKFHYVVLDESQAIKNPLAKTSKAARLLNSDHRLVLTGTPVENSTFELWSQFAFLNPGLLGNLEYFKTEFGNPIERRGDEKASNFLRKMVFPFILRRTKEQVAPELPPRTERIVYSDMESAQRKFYNKTRDYYRAMLMGVIEEQGMQHARMKVLEGLLRLRQISNHPKLVKADFRGDSSKFLLLIDTLETLQAEGHKALIFSQFVSMLKLVRTEMEARKIAYTYLDGRTRKRQERVDEFQTDPDIPFFLISLRAGGVGLNLTAADYVIHIDPWWNPAVEMQATDRTHRIGQDKPVFVYKLITRGSVEEKILKLQDKKKALVEQLITTESSFFKSITAEDVDVLFS
jgi:non-specific serine/threonine protein kinase